MVMVPVRELRNHTNDVIRRVADGEEVTITSNGVAVATLVPIRTIRRESMPWSEFVRTVPLADPELRGFLAGIEQSTDDLGPIE